MSHVDRHYKKLSPSPSPKCRKKKWGFGPIHKKGKRNWKNEANTSLPSFPDKVSAPLSPQLFSPSHERGMSLHLALAAVWDHLF